MLSRKDCLDLDRSDPLAARRDMFDLPEGVIYLDGNSLGALPRNIGPRLQAAVAGEWGRDLIRSWNTADWINLPRRVGARIAPLIGAAADEVLAADSTSVNLFKLAAGALKLRPGRRVILSEPGNFPTDLYILQGLRDFLGEVELRVVEAARIPQALDASVALLVLTHVHYKTGAVHDMAALTARAHEVGALALWDLSHSAGALPVDLRGAGADLAVGCGYKYLNGGPGAPAFLFVSQALQAQFRTPLSGWMGHAAPFAFSDEYQPAEGILRGLCGTPSVLGLTALEAALDVFDGVDMAELRAKSMRLSDLFLDLALERCPEFGRGSPRAAAQRGSQVALTHAQGYPIMQALIERGVIGDFRAPNVLRFGFTPLYLRYIDVWDAVDRLAAVMASGEWRQARFNEVSAVT
ncbi:MULTISPECIES: kynureninase [Phenylobacterium]|uniref:Kynureninase n=1 Tax=Phenylobacterium koreense TaxID=266125 RepID=A0ABV2ED52_9CAUL